jgi:hypothetical protein
MRDVSVCISLYFQADVIVTTRDKFLTAGPVIELSDPADDANTYSMLWDCLLCGA